jgi:hypothetical protein
MPELFTMLLKINAVLLLFAAAYYLILRRLTFYNVNRLFLVLGIIFSTLYPFINLTDFFHSQQQLNPEVVAFVPQLNQEVNSWLPSALITKYWPFISIVLYAGAALMALRLVGQFLSLYVMHKKSKPGAIADFPVRILNEPVGPFSFWQTVYINPNLHQAQELETIIAHENIHVKQWHSLDIILAELSVVFYWFNPGVWLMKKAVKENLEFITDQKILSNGIDRKAYQYSLLDVGSLTPAVAIVNNFNLSDLKKRIKMMNVKRSSPLTLSRYLLITPVLLVTTLAFTIAKKDIQLDLQPLRKVLNGEYFDQPKPISASVVRAHQTSTSRTTLSKNKKTGSDTSTVRHFFNQIFIRTDSTKDRKEELLTAREPLLKELEIRPIKNRDSASQSVRLVFRSEKLTDEQQAAVNANMDGLKKELNGKMAGQVTVMGFAAKFKTKTTDQARPEAVRSAIFGGNKDSVKVSNLVVYVDGKKMPKEELKKIDPEKIVSVDIVRRNTVPEIIVIGRKKD